MPTLNFFQFLKLLKDLISGARLASRALSEVDAPEDLITAMNSACEDLDFVFDYLHRVCISDKNSES